MTYIPQVKDDASVAMATYSLSGLQSNIIHLLEESIMFRK